MSYIEIHPRSKLKRIQIMAKIISGEVRTKY